MSSSREKSKDAYADFYDLLSELKVRDSTSWRSFKSLASRDKRYLAIDNDETRQKLFDRYIDKKYGTYSSKHSSRRSSSRERTHRREISSENSDRSESETKDKYQERDEKRRKEEKLKAEARERFRLLLDEVITVPYLTFEEAVGFEVKEKSEEEIVDNFSNSKSSSASSSSSTTSDDTSKENSSVHSSNDSSSTTSSSSSSLISSYLSKPVNPLLVIPESWAVRKRLTVEEMKEIFEAKITSLQHKSATKWKQLLDSERKKIGISNDWVQKSQDLSEKDGYDDIPFEHVKRELHSKWVDETIKNSLNALDTYLRTNREFQRTLRLPYSTVDDLRQLLRREASYKRLKHLREERDDLIVRYISSINPKFKHWPM